MENAKGYIYVSAIHDNKALAGKIDCRMRKENPEGVARTITLIWKFLDFWIP